jgi:hypothetical protein
VKRSQLDAQWKKINGEEEKEMAAIRRKFWTSKKYFRGEVLFAVA